MARGAVPDGVHACRPVHTVRFAGVVRVLRAFQKKSRRRPAMPKADLDLIVQRLKRAAEDYGNGQEP